MKKWIATLALAVLGLGTTQIASVNEFEDLRTNMTAARESLVTLVVNKARAARLWSTVPGSS